MKGRTSINHQPSTISHGTPQARFLDPALLLISATAIACELVLMRVFSIGQWHHFAYMVISIAMLGFGVAGTRLAVRAARLRGREAVALRHYALALAAGVPVCYAVSQRIPFDTFRLVAQPVQFLYLAAIYLVLALPFFLASACIALAFLLRPDRVGRVYAVNLAGSGLGAAAAVGLMFVLPVEEIPYVLALPAGLAYALLMMESRRDMLRALGALAALCLVISWGGRQPIRISEYKGLSYALRYPDAAVLAQAQSPLSSIVAVGSERIRETPGQISNYPMRELGALPAQIALFMDGGGASVINRCPPAAGFTGPRRDGFAYLDYVTAALPYRMLDKPRVLVVGAGGGTDVLMALSHGAGHVTAVEVDPRVIPLVRRCFGEFSGNLYDRPDVTAVTAEGRGLLESHKDQYDLIQISLLDSFTAAAAGVHALSESHLYTREALALCLERLSSGGMLAITRWLRTPARDEIKLFATMAEASEQAGLTPAGDHLVFVRSWNTGTIVASRAPLTAEQIARAREFCSERQLDLCWLPGLDAVEVNRYTLLHEPIQFEAARRILSPEREQFYRDYLFDVRPATDDCPYFFSFFKWASLRRLLAGMGVEWVPFVEWGYLALIATLVQAVVAGVVLILLPLASGAGRAATRGGRLPVLLYFAALGLAYMFLEMAMIQKFMLFLAYPVYSVAVVLSGFLVFSGAGSWWADRRRGSGVRLVAGAVAGIAVCCAAVILFLPRLFALGAGWGDGWRILGSLALLAPLACCMGVPFPAGLQAVSGRRGGLLAWAWGVNGLASVVGASLAVLIAMHAGFRALVFTAVIVYFVGAGLFPLLPRETADELTQEGGHQERV